MDSTNDTLPRAEDLLLEGATLLSPGLPWNGRAQQSATVLPEGWIWLRDGRIRALGAPHDLPVIPPGSARRINVVGHTIIPGLTDSHIHLFQVGTQLAMFDAGAT